MSAVNHIFNALKFGDKRENVDYVYKRPKNAL